MQSLALDEEKMAWLLGLPRPEPRRTHETVEDEAEDRPHRPGVRIEEGQHEGVRDLNGGHRHLLMCRAVPRGSG